MNEMRKKDMPKNKKDMFSFLLKCWDDLDNQKFINAYNSYLDNNFNYSRKRQRTSATTYNKYTSR